MLERHLANLRDCPGLDNAMLSLLRYDIVMEWKSCSFPRHRLLPNPIPIGRQHGSRNPDGPAPVGKSRAAFQSTSTVFACEQRSSLYHCLIEFYTASSSH